MMSHPISSRQTALSLRVVGLLAVLALAFAGAALWAQVMGERGIAPVAATGDIEVYDIKVDVTGSSAEDAREKGWAEARRKGWEKLGGPSRSDSQLEGMSSAIIIEREQIGPRRYIATLGVVFDRQRAGQFVGGKSGGARSAPLLTIPVLYTGGVAQVYETRGPWQRAWAQYRAGESQIDYVRPAGSGGESLLITAGNAGQRSRIWWRNILGKFDAADVIMPMAELDFEYPGGPVVGTFTARYGPDNRYLASFRLRADSQDKLPQMLSQAVVRMNRAYELALEQGILTPDSSLRQRQTIPGWVSSLIAAGRDALNPPAAPPPPPPEATETPGDTPAPIETSIPVQSFQLQFASPDAGAIDRTLSSVRGVPGVGSASIRSTALGGTSVLGIVFTGDEAALRKGLRDAGFSVSGSGNRLTISR
ncbi:heavy-metal-associated domain-containing protein [Pseudoblastomonas halimionae]|uniref:Heavy-metal-associated domain-containing protein n=1 Tax=Alteriqipengyuania halimionae TaxID=1926630 RepID=A0A6I4U3J0_9SPHN|nr:heavy-metal-associated domain-containing protein [Alteriqipengyuania halimionae]MXP09914.1 heavy-metal-associated domain-containing protein [Alteriqipengyuania halimionae]